MPDNSERSRSRPYTTAVRLLIAVPLVAIGVGLLLTVIYNPRGPHHRIFRQRNAMMAIAMALDKYREDCGAYPPDNDPKSSGSEVLAHYLCQRFAVGDMHYGPYLENLGSRLRDTNGKGVKELVTPGGNTYEYRRLNDPDGKNQRCLVIDPGPDGMLGGTIDPQKGFIPDKSILNKAGVPACEDNVYSSEPTK